MKCENCKYELTTMWRVWNWTDNRSDIWFETYKEAEQYYIKRLKDSAGMDWRLYEHTNCSNCDNTLEENCLEGEFIGDEYLQGELTKKALQMK